MRTPSEIESEIFSISSEQQFNELALEIFQFQYRNCPPYKQYCDLRKVNAAEVSDISQIPYLPIELFKSHTFLYQGMQAEQVFTSSGTTGSVVSKHHVTSLNLYEQSFIKGFEAIYGPIEDLRILALLPAYLERKGSSLVYMVNKMIEMSNHPESGFFLDDLDGLRKLLKNNDGTQTLLIGVSFALLDLIEKGAMELQNTIVMETGGMKGRKKEITRKELHHTLQKGFGVESIHSEYGMTELLSQAYAPQKGEFITPPWMRLDIRDMNDPLSPSQVGRTGGINVTDLANLYSCAFISTSDLGRKLENGKTEILGRFDFSETRGCNLMVSDV